MRGFDQKKWRGGVKAEESWNIRCIQDRGGGQG